MLDALDFSPKNVKTICLAASELAFNILEFAGHGDLIIASIHLDGRDGIEIRAKDRGPSPGALIFSLDQNDSSLQKRKNRLSLVKEAMDDFEIGASGGAGTRIVTRKWQTSRGSTA